jgi:hypothetical protein
VDEMSDEIERLKVKIGSLALKLEGEKIINKKLTADNQNLFESAKYFRQRFEFNRDKKERVIKKLRIIQQQQKVDAESAKNKNVCQALIKWEGFKIHSDGSDSLSSAITKTNNSFINTIAETQNHLGVSDLTQITTTHRMPDGKNLRDLIEFYQNFSCQEPCCLGDYRRLQNELKDKEQTLLQQINDSLYLGLERKELTVHKLVN